MSDFVHIICENYVPTSFGIAGEHGFAAMVSVGGRKVLLDTGQGVGFLNNARLMNIELKEAEALALSHGHKDHTGALMDFLDDNGPMTVVAHPKVFEPRATVRNFGGKEITLPIGMAWSRQDLESAGAKFKLSSEPMEIVPGVWFSGEVPWHNDYETEDPNLFVVSGDDLKVDPFYDDAALFLLTGRGITIVAGCAHRGIVNTMDHAKDVLGDKPLYAVIGGFHLMDSTDERIEKTVEAFKENDVKIVATGHCTGLPAGFKIAGALGEKYQFLWAGRKFEI